MAGPLLGGWFTDGPGWRWIFYINLPVGIAALVITSIALKHADRPPRAHDRLPGRGADRRRRHLAAALPRLGRQGLRLVRTAIALALLVAAVALRRSLFVLVEQRAAEPIIPLRLFRNAIFAVGNVFGFLAGVAMFGAIIFLPLYLQAVMGMSPTQSGLAMLPAVFGILTTSIVSGRLITRDRPLQDLPDPRRGDPDRGAAPAGPARRRHARTGRSPSSAASSAPGSA